MQCKSLLMIVSALVFGAPAMAQSVRCEATAHSKRWTYATVTDLENGAQALSHVKAFGAFLAADLICQGETCVGFLNGEEIRGQLKMTDHGTLYPERVSLPALGANPEAEFVCK